MDDSIPSVSVPVFGTPRYNESLTALRKELMPAGTPPTGLYFVNRDRKRHVLEIIPRLSEFTLPGDRSWARVWYLHSFKRDSVVARDFHDNVYSVYTKHMSKYAGRKKSDWKDALRDRPTKVPASASRPVTQAIDDWLTRRQFRGREQCSGTDSLLEWMRQAAWITLWMRLTQGDVPLWWVPPLTPLADQKTPNTEFTFSTPGWPPLAETKTAFVNRARAKFEEQLAAHLATATSGLPEGVEPTPDRTPVLHFQWLARFQVDGESMTAIARAPGFRSAKLTREAVSQGIHGAARHLIGPDYAKWLTPPPQGGRPTKVTKPPEPSPS